MPRQFPLSCSVGATASVSSSLFSRISKDWRNQKYQPASNATTAAQRVINASTGVATSRAALLISCSRAPCEAGEKLVEISLFLKCSIWGRAVTGFVSDAIAGWYSRNVAA